MNTQKSKILEHIELQSSEFKKIPKIFDRDDFITMQNTLDKCTLYPLDPIWREFLRARDKCILAFLYYSGARPGEILGLRYDDFNLKDCTFHIRGENNKQKKDRVLPIASKIYPYLKGLLMYGKKGDYIFPSFENRSRPLPSTSWKRIMREKILKPAGLWIKPINTTVPSTRSYSLRASFGTHILEETGDMRLVALLLGHSDYRSLKKYIFLSQLRGRQLECARDIMNAL